MLNAQWARYAALSAFVVGLGVVGCPRVVSASAVADLENSANEFGMASVTRAVPFDAPDVSEAHRQKSEPFGLRAAAPVTGALPAIWQSAARKLPHEYGILARCRRTASATCPPAAARFLAVINRAAVRNGWTRIAEINRAINLDVQPVSDATHYGVGDLWPTPLMTFAANAGDCKDYALAKFVALRELGFSADDLRIVIVHIRASAEYHALTAVRYDSHWFILDNRTFTIKRDSDVAEYEPLFVVDGENVRRMQPPPATHAPELKATPSAADLTLFAGPESLPALA